MIRMNAATIDLIFVAAANVLYMIGALLENWFANRAGRHKKR